MHDRESYILEKVFFFFFFNSFFFAEAIESRRRCGNRQVGQVRATCRFFFAWAVKALGSGSSSPGAGMDCDVLMSWASTAELETQEN